MELLLVVAAAWVIALVCQSITINHSLSSKDRYEKGEKEE
jgi:hypothetical protein